MTDEDHGGDTIENYVRVAYIIGVDITDSFENNILQWSIGTFNSMTTSKEGFILSDEFGGGNDADGSRYDRK